MTRAATVADCERLMAQMPPERRAGFSVRGFAHDLAGSLFTWAGVEPDGAVVSIGGVMESGHAGIGYLWQVIDPAAVRRNKRAYLRGSRDMLALAHRLYPYLSACLDPDNAAARRHVLRLGWRSAGVTVLPNGARALVFERGA
jgi:hypothetical protein